MSDRAYYISRIGFVLALVMMTTSMGGCEMIGGIFKAGLWVGVVIVVLVVVGIAAVVRMMRK